MCYHGIKLLQMLLLVLVDNLYSVLISLSIKFRFNFEKNYQSKFFCRIRRGVAIVNGIPVMMCMKCAISLAMGVVVWPRLDVRFAIRPITVSSPVLITTPRQVPAESRNMQFYCWDPACFQIDFVKKSRVCCSDWNFSRSNWEVVFHNCRQRKNSVFTF